MLDCLSASYFVDHPLGIRPTIGMEGYAELSARGDARSLWFFDKSGLNEVMIESIRYANSKPLHDDK